MTAASRSRVPVFVCVCVHVCVFTYVCACVCNLKCANCLYLRRQRKQFCERATLLAARVSFVCRTLNKINEGFVYGSCAVSANRPAACCGNVWHGRRILLRQLLLLLLLLRLLLQASTAAATAPASATATTFCWQLSPCTADTTHKKKHIPMMIFRVGGGNNKTDPHTTKGAASNCHMHVANCGDSLKLLEVFYWSSMWVNIIKIKCE